jgi:hypothetical protein
LCDSILAEEDAEHDYSRGTTVIAVSPYPPVDLERKLYAYLAGSDAELDEPDPTCEVSRAKAPKTWMQSQRCHALKSLAERFALDLHELAQSGANWSKNRDFRTVVLGALREPASMFVRAGLTGVKRPVKVKSEPCTEVKSEPGTKSEPGAAKDKSEPRGESTAGPAKRAAAQRDRGVPADVRPAARARKQ